jgi:hypothetical protein
MERGNEDNHEIKHERIRVKKRVKIKKKADPKAKFKKMATAVMWVVIVLLFIYALITMVKESDIRDKDKSFFTPPIVKSLLSQII